MSGKSGKSRSRSPETLRLFVAVYPPRQTARALLQAIPELDLPPHRLVHPEQIHLTLHFIGDTPSVELDAITESIRASTGGLGPFALAPQGLITLPERRRPRLLAARTDRPGNLMELQRRLAARLARRARRRPGDRFRPHLTLCRFRSPAPKPAIDVPLAVAPFEVETIELVRSTLRPDGAHHDTVTVFELATR